MIYEIKYIWQVPAKENLGHTEVEIELFETDDFHLAIKRAVDVIEAQTPPRANMWVDVGDRRISGAWVKANPEDPYEGWAHVSWCSEFVYQPKKSMRWYAAVGMPRRRQEASI